MSDDLVKRLREDQPVTQDMASTMQCALQDEAADRIEELEKELEYWRGDSAAGWDKCEEYRNKLAKVTEALGNVVEEYDLFRKDEYERGLSPLDDEIHDAHTTLAELKGEKDE